jgi:hypothetical protein
VRLEEKSSDSLADRGLRPLVPLITPGWRAVVLPFNHLMPSSPLHPFLSLDIDSLVSSHSFRQAEFLILF